MTKDCSFIAAQCLHGSHWDPHVAALLKRQRDNATSVEIHGAKADLFSAVPFREANVINEEQGYKYGMNLLRVLYVPSNLSDRAHLESI